MKKHVAAGSRVFSAGLSVAAAIGGVASFVRDDQRADAARFNAKQAWLAYVLGAAETSRSPTTLALPSFQLVNSIEVSTSTSLPSALQLSPELSVQGQIPAVPTTVVVTSTSRVRGMTTTVAQPTTTLANELSPTIPPTTSVAAPSPTTTLTPSTTIPALPTTVAPTTTIPFPTTTTNPSGDR